MYWATLIGPWAWIWAVRRSSRLISSRRRRRGRLLRRDPGRRGDRLAETAPDQPGADGDHRRREDHSHGQAQREMVQADVGLAHILQRHADQPVARDKH